MLGLGFIDLGSQRVVSVRSGVELAGQYMFSDNLDVKAIASVSRNEIKESGESFEVVLTPRQIGEVSFNYESSHIRSGVSIRY